MSTPEGAAPAEFATPTGRGPANGPGPAAARALHVRCSRLRAERRRLALVGTVAAVLGVLGLLLGTELLDSSAAVVNPDLVAGARRNPPLSALVAAAIGLVLAGLGGLWLHRSLRRTTAPDLQLDPPSDWGEGTVVVRGAALADAARADAEHVAGVASARARLLGSTAEPVLVLDLVLHRGADLGAVWRNVELQVLAPVRATVELTELPTAVHVEVESTPSSTGVAVRVA